MSEKPTAGELMDMLYETHTRLREQNKIFISAAVMGYINRIEPGWEKNTMFCIVDDEPIDYESERILKILGDEPLVVWDEASVDMFTQQDFEKMRPQKVSDSRGKYTRRSYAKAPKKIRK